MTCPASDAPAARVRGPATRGLAAGGWTEPAVETLKTLWSDESLSAAVIARRLGVSRNAVLGKIHRLGLSNRRTGPKAPRAQRPARLPRPGRPAASARSGPPRPPSSTAPPHIVEVGPGLVAHLEDIAPHGCHWPIGDPLAEDFRFCGRRADTAPYCDAHRSVAYQPGGPKPLEGLLKRCAA